MRRVKPGLIRCVDCREETQPSKKDSIYCAPCAKKLYARLSAADGEDIDGIALLDRMFRNNQHTPAHEEARGDGERMFAGDVFEVRHGNRG